MGTCVGDDELVLDLVFFSFHPNIEIHNPAAVLVEEGELVANRGMDTAASNGPFAQESPA